MHYHIILTERCNSRCKYCYEKSMEEFENGLEAKWQFDESPFYSVVEVEKLKKFLKPEDTLIFYGGEPLIMIDKIKEIMNYVDCRFCMQTNAKLIDKLETKYLLKLDKILVSIDGTKETTDYNKGNYTYEKVISNLKNIRERGFEGEIVARMVVSQEFPDVYSEVLHLIKLINEGIFDSIHFQIDAGFYKHDFNYEKFNSFVKTYNKSLTRLIDYWMSEIKKGKVIKIYPFLGIFDSINKGESSLLRCGSGYANFTITTSGKISACPIMNSVKNFYCGDIEKGIVKEIHCIEPCTNCEYYSICGGRCLYSNYAKLWPEEGQELICKTIIHLIEEIKRITPEIEKLIEKGIVKDEDFYYEKYFGPEIIP